MKNIVGIMKRSKLKCPKKKLFSFKNHNCFIKVPFVVYADFEAFTEDIFSCETNDDKSFTNKYQKQSGFYYKIVCFDKNLSDQKPVLYRTREKDEGKKDEDIDEKFVEMLEEDIKKIHKEFDFSKKMIFT